MTGVFHVNLCTEGGNVPLTTAIYVLCLTNNNLRTQIWKLNILLHSHESRLCQDILFWGNKRSCLVLTF